MINSALDRLLSLFTHFVFIFIDIYFHLRITIRESIVSKPLINKTKFKKYFVILDEAKHFVFELGDEKNINPFLRADDQKFMDSINLKTSNPEKFFSTMRLKKDNF